MSSKNKIRPTCKIYLRLFGITDITERKQLSQLLNAFESNDLFFPELISKDERKYVPYDRHKCIEEITNNQQAYLKFERSIEIRKRKGAVKYGGYFTPCSTPSVGIDINHKLSKKHYPALLQWSQNIVDAFRPDYASLLFLPEYDEAPWPTELDKSLNSFFLSSWSYHAAYKSAGASGIGMYTWLSNYLLDHIGLENIESTPNIFTKEQDWGGAPHHTGSRRRTMGNQFTATSRCVETSHGVLMGTRLLY